ncbi:hypothetical protein [Methylorubrum sp. SB2]|uniref:hypothetical protein n=1 Tax=Methylorubrum subtropicum TaxID=3138812 RepID=UPI00313E5021
MGALNSELKTLGTGLVGVLQALGSFCYRSLFVRHALINASHSWGSDNRHSGELSGFILAARESYGTAIVLIEHDIGVDLTGILDRAD